MQLGSISIDTHIALSIILLTTYSIGILFIPTGLIVPLLGYILFYFAPVNIGYEFRITHAPVGVVILLVVLFVGFFGAGRVLEKVVGKVPTVLLGVLGIVGFLVMLG